jgi:ATP-binding cassette, subfamily B, bacterial
MRSITEQKTTFPNTPWEFARHFFQPYRAYFVVMILINLSVATYISVQPYVLKKLLDAATPLLGNEALLRATLLPASLLIALTIFNNLAWRLNNYVTMKTSPALKADIIDQASDYVHGHSFKFFQDNLSGAISNRIVDLANNADTLIFNSRGLFQNFVTIISAILISALANPIFAVVFLIWTLIFIRAAFYFSKAIEPYSKIFAESRSHAVGNVVDSFANAISVILFARKSYEKEYLRKSLDEMVTKDKLLQKKLMRYAFIMASLVVSVQVVKIGLLLFL